MTLKLFSRRKNKRAPIAQDALPTVEEMTASSEARFKSQKAKADRQLRQLTLFEVSRAERLVQELRQKDAHGSTLEGDLALVLAQRNEELVRARKRDFAKLRAYAAAQEVAEEAAALKAEEARRAAEKQTAVCRSESCDSYVTAPEAEPWNAWLLEEMRRVRLARVPEDDSSTICTIRSFHTAVEYLA